MKAEVALLPRSLKIEQSAVQSQRFLDVTDLERYMI
jgi:hypothetical protein